MSLGQGTPGCWGMTVLGLGRWLPTSAPSGYLAAQAAVARGPLLFSGALSEGQFYSPPESFAGASWWVGELPLGRGVGWVCSFCSCQLPGESEQPSAVPTFIPLHHCTCTPTSPGQHSLHLFPLSSACFLQGLTMNQMKKLLGRKASLPRYLAA